MSPGLPGFEGDSITLRVLDTGQFLHHTPIRLQSRFVPLYNGRGSLCLGILKDSLFPSDSIFILQPLTDTICRGCPGTYLSTGGSYEVRCFDVAFDSAMTYEGEWVVAFANTGSYGMSTFVEYESYVINGLEIDETPPIDPNTGERISSYAESKGELILSIE